MKFEEKYTTLEKKQEDSNLPEKEQKEQNKIIISNDAYALGELIELLFNKIEHLRISLIK